MALADWDPRLLTPERALHLAGDWPVFYTAERSTLSEFDLRNKVQLHQRCGQCQQSITALAWSEDMPNLIGISGPPTTPGDQLSDVIRHMVTAHDLSLSGASEGHTTPDAGGPLAVSPSGDHARLIDAITEEQAHG